jgi:hypothetical protein
LGGHRGRRLTGELVGFAAEYWSPPPNWKDSNSYYGGSLNSTFDQGFLAAFAEARVADLTYLQSQGLKVSTLRARVVDSGHGGSSQ